MSTPPQELAPGCLVSGLVPNEAVTIEAVQAYGESTLKVIYRGSGGLGERMLCLDDMAELSVLEGGRPWSFDGDGEVLRLASEAYRFRLAWLFDPFVAISTSAVEPLPHQISAVYEEMLPRLPMRFLLADDPGAGKTIMAGLLIKEMLVRGDLRRCLVISPGSLTEQWQDELQEKFGLDFSLLTRDMIHATHGGNPFQDNHRLIARMDQLSRNEDLQERLLAAPEWDLIIVDEAHRMSASYMGGEVKRTKRYQLGQRIGGHCRNFLLMTATPHNGHEESFQLFMALLDSDRFEGKFRDGVHQQDPSDLMRRMIKEELVRFDGTPLFPERRSYTAEYTLSDMEAHLYQEVTHYVRTEMNRADRIAGKDGSRRVNVGFALMTLQRRLASSSLAIYKSLTRRRERLESRLREEQILLQGRKAGEGLVGPSADAAPLNLGSEDDWDDLYDDTPQEELEDLEEELVDNATAAQSIEELQAEIVILTELEGLAKQVVQRGQDAKWTQLQQLLDHPLMKGPNGERRKLVIFSEYKDTLHYLAERIRTYIGRHEPVVEIHGGVGREERRKIVHAFMNDPEVQILVANDAAGEGVNLQRAHLMVNYDLPWNPNRLEQRFGRIHRIGQKEVCHLWNLIASNTREGDVYVRLLHKLEAEAEALQGKVFDVLGQLFEQRPLRHLLKEAIVYGEDPAVKARLYQEVEGAFDPAHLQDIMDRRALAQDTMDTSHLAAIRDEIERAEAARLQPFYIEAFFLKAFERLGGRIHKREKGRYEITHVPQSVRDRDRIVGSGAPVLKRYERICFDKEHLEPSPRAELVCPGHPLLDATIDLTLERSEGVMKQGAILVDKGDPGDKPRLLFYIEHAIQDGRRVADGSHRVISKRLQYLETSEAGGFRAAGPAPYVDYDWLPPEDLALVEQHLEEPWLQKDWDHEVISWASTTLVPEHLREVKAQRLPAIEKAKNEIRGRLLREINHWDSRAQGLRDRELAGQKTRLSAAQAAERSRVLEERLHSREADLELERSINAQPPRLVGGVLVIPQGLLTRLRGEESTTPSDSVDAEARKRIELLAMDAVIKAELCLGRVPEDVSARRGIGYDILSKPSNGEGETLFIEVKGRVAGSMDVTLTTNEIRCSNNKPAQFVLAVVEVEGDAPGEPTYVRGFDFGRPGFDQTSAKYQLSSLLQHGAPPQ